MMMKRFWDSIPIIYLIAVPLAVGCLVGLIMGNVTKKINEKKGYTGGYWIGFWLGLIGLIIVLAKPDANRIVEEKQIEGKQMKNVFKTLGMLTGILMIVLGMYTAFFLKYDESYSGTSPKNRLFGADYYSEQYGVTKDAADNIKNLGSYISGATRDVTASAAKVCGLFISGIGLAVFCAFGMYNAQSAQPNPANHPYPSAVTNMPNIPPNKPVQEAEQGIDRKMAEEIAALKKKADWGMISQADYDRKIQQLLGEE